jgi:hypothetical protein
MGCVCLVSRQNGLEIFENFEGTLKIHSTDASFLFESLLKAAGRGQTLIKKETAELIWLKKGLKISKNLKFYSYFLSKQSESTYNSRLLSNLIILFGNVPINLKAILFWMNYTSVDSKSIDSSTLKEMIEDILFIVLEVVPRNIETLKENQRFVRNCIQKFSLVKPFLIDWFLKKILPLQKEIRENDFIQLFQDSKIALLANSNNMRKFALEFEENLENRNIKDDESGLSNDVNAGLSKF